MLERHNTINENVEKRCEIEPISNRSFQTVEDDVAITTTNIIRITSNITITMTMTITVTRTITITITVTITNNITITRT